jgi:hypothetical protein
MVQSSYKNRKKNRKQSFKRRITGGNRKVKFIEDDDKMVGGEGEQEHIAKLVTKYSGYPLGSLIRTAFSNSICATEEGGVCSVKGISSLINAHNNCKQIIGIGKDNDKLNALFFESFKYNDTELNAINTYKQDDNFYYRFIEDVMKFICINVFIPKGLIKNVYVQNDDGNEWTTLTNKSFKEIKSGADTASNQRAAAAVGETVRRANTDPDDGDTGENDETYTHLEETRELDSSRHINAAGSGNSGKQKALAPKGAVTVGLGQGQFDVARDKALEDEQQQRPNIIRNGDKVEVKNKHTESSGKWFPATVTNVKENGNFDIKYDDGGEEDGVRRDDVRRRPTQFVTK